MKKIKFLALLAAAFCAVLMAGCSHSSSSDNGSGGDDGSNTGDGKYVTFVGNEAFSLGLNTNEKTWEGTLYCCTENPGNEDSWRVWEGYYSEEDPEHPGDADEITAKESNGKFYIYLRGKGNTHLSSDSCVGSGRGILYFTEDDGDDTLTIECNGNIMRLLDYEDPESAEMAEYCFASFFYYNTYLTKAPELPASTLSEGCYYQMFASCTNLTAAPDLSAAEAAAAKCYYEMFFGCENMTKGTELPATTLAEGCYHGMFSNCRKLTEGLSETLPADELVSDCYYVMFSDCVALEASPAIAATTYVFDCCNGMFSNCSSLTSVGKIAGGNVVTLVSNALEYMFQGCESLSIELTDAGDGFITIGKDSASQTQMFCNCQYETVDEKIINSSGNFNPDGVTYSLRVKTSA